MKKLMLIAIGALLLISVLMLLLVPEQPITPPAREETVSMADQKEAIEKARANAALLVPTPSGVQAQWVPAEEAKILMDASNALILDVRTQEEYEQGHIKGAKLIPLEELEERASAELPDQWKMILIYDGSGESCMQAAKILTDRMYMNVFVFGGIKSWPYDTVK